MSDTVLEQDSPKGSVILTWLFNPFHFIAGWTALGIGLAAIVVAGLIAFASDSHFDGVIDFHSGLPAPVWLPVAEGLINWLSMAVPLFLVGKLVSKTRFRAVDVFGTQAFARWPGLLSVLAALLPGYRAQVLRFAGLNLTLDPSYAGGFITACIFIFIATIWTVVLLYRAYAVSCNVSGVRGIASFIPTLVIAEVLSKAALMALLKVTLG